MKSFFIAIVSILLINACTPKNELSKPPLPDSVVVSISLPVIDSIIVYTLGPKEITLISSKFIYDERKRLSQMYSTTADTTVPGNVYPDTISIRYEYPGTDSLPDAFSVWIPGNHEPGDGIIHHYLTYDDQQRVSRDSQSKAFMDYHYVYSDGIITTQKPNNLDSFYIAGKNLTRYSLFFEAHAYTFSQFNNPYFIPVLSNHVGPAMPGPEMMSVNLFSSRLNIFTGTDTEVNYTWKTNEKGQVISGIGIDRDTKLAIEYYWFVYKD